MRPILFGEPTWVQVTSICDSAPWWHDMRWHTFRNSQWLDARGCMSSISFSGVTDWELLGVTWLPAGCTGKWQYERNDKMTRIRWQENDKMRSHSFIFFRLLVVWCCMMLYVCVIQKEVVYTTYHLSMILKDRKETTFSRCSKQLGQSTQANIARDPEMNSCSLGTRSNVTKKGPQVSRTRPIIQDNSRMFKSKTLRLGHCRTMILAEI